MYELKRLRNPGCGLGQLGTEGWQLRLDGRRKVYKRRRLKGGNRRKIETRQ